MGCKPETLPLLVDLNFNRAESVKAPEQLTERP
jgi:hypothetical protein